MLIQVSGDGEFRGFGFGVCHYAGAGCGIRGAWKKKWKLPNSNFQHSPSGGEGEREDSSIYLSALDSSVVEYQNDAAVSHLEKLRCLGLSGRREGSAARNCSLGMIWVYPDAKRREWKF